MILDKELNNTKKIIHECLWNNFDTPKSLKAL